MPTRVIRVRANNFAISPERKRPTTYLQNRAGFMQGRTNVAKSQSDKLKVMRVTRYVDVNKNNREDKADLYPGEIIGRTRAAKKPSVIEVRRHWRSNGVRVAGHKRGG